MSARDVREGRKAAAHETVREGRNAAAPTEAELAAVDLALRGLAPLEPSPRAIARTQAALVGLRARRRRRVMLGGLMVALATVLASVGLATLGRSLDQAPTTRGPAADELAQAEPKSAARARGTTAHADRGRGTLDEGEGRFGRDEAQPSTALRGVQGGEVALADQQKNLEDGELAQMVKIERKLDDKVVDAPTMVGGAGAVASADETLELDKDEFRRRAGNGEREGKTAGRESGLDVGGFGGQGNGADRLKAAEAAANVSGQPVAGLLGPAGTFELTSDKVAKGEVTKTETTTAPVPLAETEEEVAANGAREAAEGTEGVDHFWARGYLNKTPPPSQLDLGIKTTPVVTEKPPVTGEATGQSGDLEGLYRQNVKSVVDTKEGDTKGKDKSRQDTTKVVTKETRNTHATDANRIPADSDGDGIVDVTDRCDADNRGQDGCPLAFPAAPPAVAVTRSETEAVVFAGKLKPVVQEIDTLVAGDRTFGWDAGNAAPTFIPASGYFANTYVPGDPQLAFLRAAIAAPGTDAARIPAEALAKPVTQPFDAPRDQALGLQLSADRTAINGPTRVTLQVGLSGAAQAPSRRAPLAVAMVVDLGSLGAASATAAHGTAAASDADRRALWSIADAFASERKAGDHMSLVVPVGGATGGVEVLRGNALTSSDVARFLASALERNRATGAAASPIGPALAQAYAEVHQGMAADAALGANVVIVATARAGSLPSELAERAHREALQNVQLAVITTGRDAGAPGGTLGTANDTASAALAAAGQGRRWLVNRPEEAARAVSKELGAAGRAVARAVRLRIRLAPGVKLIGVLGSHPLAVPETTRVREAERAIDRKVAETTGIREDRGADEDGIQIVIPAFMADDDHAILLDVLVPGPGPVLDVRARFKDLVRMQNGETQASLALESGTSAATRLTTNVLENRAALEVATALREASQALASDVAQALARIVRSEQTLASVRAPIAAQRALLAAYHQLLNDQRGGWTGRPEQVTRVQQAMLLAAATQLGLR